MNKITPGAKTFDEWKALGYHVQRGQKATSWTKDGKARFDREQVTKTILWQDESRPQYDEEPYWAHPDYYDAIENIGDKD